MNLATRFLAPAVLLLSLAGVSAAQPVIQGDRLVTRDGFSLYVFDNDTPGSGKSVCHAACANVFPPYLAAAGAAPAGAFSILSRDDSSKQWAYKGRPLYRFYADEKPGDKGGDGLNRNTWHIAPK